MLLQLARVTALPHAAMNALLLHHLLIDGQGCTSSEPSGEWIIDDSIELC
jgi:hypothetical protein